MIDHDQQASAHNADIPYDILKQAAMLLVKAREAEQRRSPREAVHDQFARGLRDDQCRNGGAMPKLCDILG